MGSLEEMINFTHFPSRLRFQEPEQHYTGTEFWWSVLVETSSLQVSREKNFVSSTCVTSCTCVLKSCWIRFEVLRSSGSMCFCVAVLGNTSVMVPSRKGHNQGMLNKRVLVRIGLEYVTFIDPSRKQFLIFPQVSSPLKIIKASKGTFQKLKRYCGNYALKWNCSMESLIN